MRSLLVAAALGLGLLSAAATVDPAAAAPYRAGISQPGTSLAITPVHYQRHGYHRPHYAPPPRHHWHRYAPPPRHAWRQPRPHQYGSRY